MAINKNYITVEYLLETYNSQHRGNYDDATLQYYIDYASIRIENLTNNLVWDFDSSETWRQDLYKYAIAVMTEHWLKQGNNLSLTDVSGTVGSVSFSTSATNNVEYVPKLVLDLLIRSGAREHSSFDMSSEGVGPLSEYSPVFKTQQLLKDVSIEEGSSDALILLTKQRAIELLADATAGEFQFATGEYLHDMNLIGDAADNFIYKQTAVDGLLIPITEDIARLFQQKANATDVYTKGIIDIQQQQQDTLIRANNQKANSNTAQINAIKQTLDSGGVAVESFLSINEATISNTPIYSNSPIDVESNNDLILDNTAYIDELITTHDVKVGGRFSIVIEGDIIRGNTNSVTTMRVSLMKYNGVNDYEFIKSLDKAFDFTAQSTISGVSASIDHNVNADEKYFLQFEILEAGQTVTFAAEAKFTASVYSSIGSGVISTSDDWINTSTIIGGTGTEALDWIGGELTRLDADKADADSVYTITESDALLSDKADKTELETKQDKTDATLTTTDKTIVGGINEVNTNKADKTELDETNSKLDEIYNQIEVD